ncbi:MAG: gliding motility-associated C-terminal domain-containing protein [Chitinophagaceae bacterium]|nr:gliding motility-associated C-terminal domain-containing protein [Chitinophagaceae bacterium]
MGASVHQIKKTIFLHTVLLFAVLRISAQVVCPPNIDFENGIFSNWKTYTGNVSAAGGANNIILTETAPQPGRHEIFSRAANINTLDYFGNFPVVCPNGSGYSVKLGNTSGGAQAEGVSYEFTIPANRNQYSITYYYAVVFEGPSHQEYQQPRLEIEVMDLTSNQRIDCATFTFISYGSGLPGFNISLYRQNENAPVLYKTWTPVTINLNNRAGKTIRLFFKTADCTFVRHFGYAYVDVNTGCSGEFPGSAFCKNDTAIKVTAPFGFDSYKWFNADFSKVLGTSNELILKPVPSSDTKIAVEITPFPGFGCKDTMYTQLYDTLTVKAEAGSNASYCGITPVLIGEPPKDGRVYSWTPVQGLSDPGISNPLASPGATTTYKLRVSSYGGGCVDEDEVEIKAELPDTTIRFLGKNTFCITSGDSAVFIASDLVSVQWYKDGNPVAGATQKRFRAPASGVYYAVVKHPSGCSLKTRSVEVKIDRPQQPVTYPLRYTFPDKEITLTARAIGDTVLWNPTVYLSNDKIFSPAFKSPKLGTYSYLIRIAALSGCFATDTQQVKVIAKVEVFVPNAFTPNNDGLNDVLSAVTIGIQEIQYFRIFNRYGTQVYSWQPGKEGWDGMYKNVLQNPDTYAWQFSGVGVDGQTYTQKGTLVLIR